MAQHDYIIANQSGAAFRSDLNNGLAAIVSNNSGAAQPSTTYAYQWWADTTTGLLKIRNAANNAWITIGTLGSANLGLLALGGGTLTGALLADNSGTAALPAVAFDGDTDTGIFRAGADQFGIATNGVERVEFGTSEVVFNDGGADVDFRVEGDTKASLFVIDAGTDAISMDGNVTIANQNDLRFGDSDNSNWVALQAPGTVSSNVTFTLPAADGTANQVLKTDGSGAFGFLTAVTQGTAITAGTSVASTSGTSIDFTSIPSWVKRVTVMFAGVSTNGTSITLIQLGSGSVQTSGYTCAGISYGASSSTTIFTNGFATADSTAATDLIHGQAVFTLLGSNIYVGTGMFKRTTIAGTTQGSVTLSGTLDRLRITTVNGTDTFDAGSINILYEG